MTPQRDDLRANQPMTRVDGVRALCATQTGDDRTADAPDGRGPNRDLGFLCAALRFNGWLTPRLAFERAVPRAAG